MARKTWSEKLYAAKTPYVEVLKAPSGGLPAGARMLISTPLEVKAAVEALAVGQSLTLAAFRDRLAAGHDADGACPMTTSIFMRIVAEAAIEAAGVDLAAAADAGTLTPFWRAVAPDDALAGKLSCGREFIMQRRLNEAV